MIVVSGEALFDVFEAGDTASGLMLDARIGGSPFNVSVGLARLGRPVAFFGGVSSGFLGRRLQRALNAEGIDTGCLHHCDAPTTLSLVGLDAQGVAHYSFMGAGAADRELPLAALAQVPEAPQARAFQFGSYAMVVEPVASTLRALVEREHARSFIAYDVNVRLNVEPDLHRWHDTLQWMLRRTTFLKLSDEDLALLHPGLAEDEFAAACLAQGVTAVALTRGGRGASLWTASQRCDVEPQTVSVVDTVGAGDTFQAAMLTSLAEEGWLSATALGGLGAAELQRLLAFASRAAALTCTRRGADLPRRGELPAV